VNRLLPGALLLCCAPSFSAPKYDLIIRNGRIVDGTGAAWFRGDLAISGGKIAAIGELDPSSSATTVVDAADKYVAPGFIDVHTHCEGDMDREPEAQNFIRMGVTTLVTGNCGSSTTNIGDEFTSLTKQGIGVNYATLIGHNSVRRKVMENVNRDPSTTELLAMKELVAKGMREGAVGLSTGLIYNPGIFTKTEEIVELAREVAKYKGIYVSHMRSEGLNVTKAIDEALTIGLQAKVPVNISHFKVSAPKRFGQSSQTLQMVEDARQAGQDVTVDQYVYTASSTGISTFLPEWASEGNSTEVRNRLMDPTTRKRLIEQIVEERIEQGRQNLDYAKIASFRGDPSVNGKSILEVAKLWKNSDSWEAQVDTVLDIVTSGGAGMVFHSMDEMDVQRIASYPHTMFASDSGVRQFKQGVPHPRGYGNNARVLGRYVRDLKLLRLEDAVRKMTSLPARTMRFMDRGILRPGMAADVVVFDFEKVNDASTFEQPHAYAEGFNYVLVNGVPVINAGELTQARSGQVLRGAGSVVYKEADPQGLTTGEPIE